MKGEFDQFVQSYDADLAKGLSVTGEDKNYFARMRIEWLAGFFKEAGIEHPRKILDYGCGDGGSIPFLSDKFAPEQLIGVDISSESIHVAAKQNSHISKLKFENLHSFFPDNEFDLVYTNGVFHHIPPDERPEAFEYIYRALRVGGYFAFWENNPWNLGTRYVMSRIPFDRDAKMLFPREVLRAMRRVGYHVERKDFMFVFPAFLKRLRVLERRLVRLPLGGQYLIVGRKM